ncbi:MAG: hypothetical protein SCAL_000915 [Candidatus Syntrophoarchaeum caldarius]|uniref:Uncharacterized protein n=1 Tax=Candidatus Syntropharchaeum caldarium TaxID=1838285 RepID=A0A1F2PB39_9EURY|nr:MAG: hypothetical protein SCAL_000915 [Candidatus Syntrophoarchaeum caldarius]
MDDDKSICIVCAERTFYSFAIEIFIKGTQGNNIKSMILEAIDES